MQDAVFSIQIMPVLDKSGIANCLIIVTRYFGGTLLGTGGLIRAYSEAAKSGIEASGIMEVKKGIQAQIDAEDRKSTRLNSSHLLGSRMPSSA